MKQVALESEPILLFREKDQYGHAPSPQFRENSYRL